MKDIPPNIEFMVSCSEFCCSFLIEMNRTITLVANGNTLVIEYATSGFNA